MSNHPREFRRDILDAQPIPGNSEDGTPFASGTADRPGALFGSKATHEEDYTLNRRKRGMSFIFNQVEFEQNIAEEFLITRHGSDKDAHDLSQVLKELNFDVEIVNNMTVAAIKVFLDKVTLEYPLWEYDSLIITILTHGAADGKIYAKDSSFLVRELYSPFLGNEKCPALVGKPKMVFVQACRGVLTDPGTEMEDRGGSSFDRSLSSRSGEDREKPYVVPVTADVLLMFSSWEGMVSFRDTANGSWFIQALCDSLRCGKPEDDIMKILTGVNRRVAFEKLAMTDNGNTNFSKQMPTIVSMLTKSFYLKK